MFDKKYKEVVYAVNKQDPLSELKMSDADFLRGLVPTAGPNIPEIEEARRRVEEIIKVFAVK